MTHIIFTILELSPTLIMNNTKYLLANIIFMSSLFDQGLFDNQGGLGLGQVSMAIMFNPPLRFSTSHMNSQAMCLPFVSIARSWKFLIRPLGL